MSRKVVMTILAIVLLLGLTANTVFAQAGSPVQPAAEKYFAGGTKNIAAKDLYTNLNDGDKSNDPYMIDIRASRQLRQRPHARRDQRRSQSPLHA